LQKHKAPLIRPMGACKSKTVSGDGEEDKSVKVQPTKSPLSKAPSGTFSNIDNTAGAGIKDDHFANEDQLKWMNYMIIVMWPHVRKAMQKKANDKFHEKMDEELSKHSEIKLDTLELDFDPGNRPPRIFGLLVYERTQQERKGIQVDVDFSWHPDKEFTMKMNMHGSAKGFPIHAEGVGVSEMKVNGTMSCLLAPLLDYEPCVGTGQLFFLDTPQIIMKVLGMKKLGPVGKVLTSVMQGVVKNILAEGYILPHRFVQKVRKDLPLETMVTAKSPLPLGLLIIDVLEGRKLPAADTSITGKKSSDPFVEIKVGYGTFRSSTAENTLDPKWKDPPCHLFVYNVAQLVRITVHDDDVMGADILGTVIGYNVFLLAQRGEESKDGLWLDLQDQKGSPAGQIKIRVRYFDVSDLIAVPKSSPASAESRLKSRTDPSAPPFLLTVKLLGLEAEDRGDLRNTRATVEIVHPAAEEKVDTSDHNANRLMAGLESAMSWMGAKVKAVTGLGFGHLEDGVPTKRKSTKAVLWGSNRQLEDADHHVIPPMAIRAMEKLHVREGWPIEKIADMFQLERAVVETAVNMRGNFEVVWHEALHFLQPAKDPFLGKVKITVQAPASNQVRGADDRGFIGEFEIDLKEDAPEALLKGNAPHYRRIRRMLYRPRSKADKKAEDDIFAKKGTESATVQDSVEHGPAKSHEGMECTGILIEVLVELRELQAMPCELDRGQTLRDADYLRKTTLESGVRMIPE